MVDYGSLHSHNQLQTMLQPILNA